MILLRTGLHAVLALAAGTAAAQDAAGPKLPEPPLITVEEAARPPPKPQGAEVPQGEEKAKGAAPARVEEATVLARSELAVGQTIHGIGQGLLLCTAAACRSQQAWASALLIGGGVGLGASVLGTWGGISGGPAATINSGSAWGLAEGAWTLGLVAGGGSLERAAGLLSATTLAGTGVGVAVALFLQPTGGQVALANSGGIWTSLLAFLVVWPWAPNFAPQTLPAIELVATNVGLAGVAFLSTKIEVSRGRMFLIDASGLVGLLLGYTAFQFAGLAPSTTFLGPMMAAGAVAGLAAGTALTSGIDAPVAAKVALVPGGPEGTPGVTVLAAF